MLSAFSKCVQLLTATTRYRQDHFKSSIATLSILATGRVASRWNQAGQKRAGSPDIAVSFIPTNQHILWLLVSMSYIYIGMRLALYGRPRGSILLNCVIILTLIAALRFKIAFTQLDAPELLSRTSLARWFMLDNRHPPLAGQAQLLFYGLLVTGLMGTVRQLSWGKPRERRSGE